MCSYFYHLTISFYQLLLFKQLAVGWSGGEVKPINFRAYKLNFFLCALDHRYAQDQKKPCRIVVVFVMLLSISLISCLFHVSLLFLQMVNERHRIPHPTGKLCLRKNHLIGVVCDDDVQSIRFGSTTPPAVIRFVGPAPVKQYANDWTKFNSVINLLNAINHRGLRYSAITFEIFMYANDQKGSYSEQGTWAFVSRKRGISWGLTERNKEHLYYWWVHI